MEKNRPRLSIISTGTTSIVLIFVMLCMLTFSVLSLVSAQANLRLSQKSADRTTEYYAAENAANDILIELEKAAALAAERSGQEADPARAVLDVWDGAEDVSAYGGRLAYQVSLGEEQLLTVELSVDLSAPEDGRYCHVETWKVISTHDWSPDESLELMDLGSMPTGLE